MTEINQTPQHEAVSDADGQTTPPGGNETGEADNGSQEPKGREERFRKERNAAIAERDALAQRIEQMQRAEIERLASDQLSMPADLFSLSGNSVADYLTEDGNVDAEKVAADVAAVLAERPGLGTRSPAFDPSLGTGGNPGGKKVASWADAFKAK